MSEMDALLKIMAQLRDPEGGCPWDLEQTHSSISPHTIEEAYEVDEAIRSGDPEALRDELGDLLFQVVFQSRIAEEQGTFDFAGVVEAITSKLVRRHPHIFAEAETPTSSAGQLESWEDIKAAERAASVRADAGPPDPFTGIPRHLPALARSAKIAGRVDRLDSAETGTRGADPKSRVLGALAGLDSARTAIESAAVQALDEVENEAADASVLSRQIGEGLRSWVRLARALGVDPEQALRDLDEERISEIRAQAGKR
jgi:ATP diphosphatase